MNIDDALSTFVSEGQDLLDAMEAALLQIEHDPHNADLINSIFRAAHTIKGSAGLFGLDYVVAFTHGVENVLDRVRAGELVIDGALTALLLKVCDHMRALVACVAARGTEPAPADLLERSTQLLADLQRATGAAPRPAPNAATAAAGVNAADGTAGATGTNAAAGTNAATGANATTGTAGAAGANTPNTNTPPNAPDGSGAAAAGTGESSANWHLSLRLNRDVLRNGMDPLSFIRYLTTIGKIVAIVTVTDALPKAAEMDPEACYLGFELDYRSDADRATIESAFEFVRDDAQIRILAPHSPLSDYLELACSLPEGPARAGELLVRCGTLSAAQWAGLAAQLAAPLPATGPTTSGSAAQSAVQPAGAAQPAAGSAAQSAVQPAGAVQPAAGNALPPAGATQPAAGNATQFAASNATQPAAGNATQAPAQPAAAAQPTAAGAAPPARPAAPAQAARSRPQPGKRAHGTYAGLIHVNADKLDEHINLIGELIIASATVSQSALASGSDELQEATSVLDRLVENIRDSALQLRMVQIGPTFNKFQRVVHDMSRELGKDIRLVISGAETELDRTVVEKIGDPLMHLVRNSLDHGIEPAAVRRARGKPAQGTLRLNAYQNSGSIVIEVSDDGGGLASAKIRAKAIERGLVKPDQQLTEAEIHALIFEPGLSTSEHVSNLSGRGVGMDVVRRNIFALRGSIDIESHEGVGTTTRIRLPLTLAIIDGFLVEVGGASFIVPLEMVVECVELTAADRAAAHGRQQLNLRGEVLPFIRLNELFEMSELPGAARGSAAPHAPAAAATPGGAAAAAGRRENIVVVDCSGQRAGLVVDTLRGEYQTVIRPLGAVFNGLPGVAGFTLLGSGQVALILDVPGLVKHVAQREARRTPSRRLAAAPVLARV